MSSGLAVALRMMPTDTDGLPFSRTLERSLNAACSTRATSFSRTVKPLDDLSATSLNWVTVFRSVRAVTLNSRCWLSMRPAGTSRFWRRSASSTSCVVRRYAASWSGSTQMRIEYLRSPLICTSATPGTVCRRGLTMRVTMSVISSGFSTSLLNASQITGNASASTLAITGSSIASGRRWRMRDTRSRTSAAASSGFFSSLKRAVIWLCSEREIEVRMSMPSMPAIESSSGLVTWDSITSDDAPISRVLTVTTGSSMRGYSRTASLPYDTAPTSITINDSTDANTGRRMEISDKRMNQPPAMVTGPRRWCVQCPMKRPSRASAHRCGHRPVA